MVHSSGESEREYFVCRRRGGIRRTEMLTTSSCDANLTRATRIFANKFEHETRAQWPVTRASQLEQVSTLIALFRVCRLNTLTKKVDLPHKTVYRPHKNFFDVISQNESFLEVF